MKCVKFALENPGFPENSYPSAMFYPEILYIRKKEGQKPEHVTLIWKSAKNCGEMDLRFLLDYLESKGRDCHINTGVHGALVDGKFEYAWEEKGGDQLRQDIKNAVWHYEYKDGEKIKRHRKTDVSFHMVNKITGPYYHVGVDTIDAFCFSKYKKLTEKELDKVFVDFCVSRGIPQDEKDSDAEQFTNKKEQPKDSDTGLFDGFK